MKSIAINGRPIGPDHPPYVIAEACVNHQGSYAIARQMVYSAHAMGADAIKFQMHVPENEMLDLVPPSSNFAKPLLEILRETELTPADHRNLMALCRDLGIQYLCTPFSRAAADRLDELGIQAFKIGSGELTNIPLLEHIARKGKPMIVSTGMSLVEEIAETVAAIEAIGAPLALTHCVSAYPAPYEIVNLGLIPIYRERFGVPVGLSDHSDGVYTCLGAVALGASILEKHFSLNRWWPGPDHRVSIEPQELLELTKGAKAVHSARGASREIFAEERQIVAWARESVVSEVAIGAGAEITPGMVWVKRPGPGATGIPAKDLPKVLGRRAARPIAAHTQLAWSDLE